MGQPVLVGAGVFAPRVAEIDVDTRNFVLRRKAGGHPLNVQTGNEHVVRRKVFGGVGGLHLALGQNQHLVGDVDAQIVDVRMGRGQLGQKASLAAAQLQMPGLLRAGVQAVPLPRVGERLMHMEIAGQQLRPGVGLETHSHKNTSLFKSEYRVSPFLIPNS